MKQELLQEIASYWGTRAEGYSEVNEKELAGSQREAWLHVLEEQFPEKKKEEMKILDIGTGPGFFPMILSEAGYTVTAVDYTEEMLEKAKENLGKYTKYGLERVTLQRMDAQNLEFADETFDVVISRNLTWTLPHPQEAYREWQRVLKPGGLLLNFDGNYGKADFTGKGEKLPENHAHKQIAGDLMQECEAIKDQLEISYHVRPAWDVTALGEAGFEQIKLDLGISKRIYIEKDEFYNPTPLFCIAATKN